MISSIFDRLGNVPLLHFWGRPEPPKLTPPGAVSGSGVDHVSVRPGLVFPGLVLMPYQS